MNKRILHIASGDFFSTYGGGQVYVKNVVDEMIRQGLEVGILSTIDTRHCVEKKLYKGVPIYEVGSFASAEELISLIKDFNPVLIHAHSRKGEISLIAKQLGIPVTVTSHHGGIVCPAGTLMGADDRLCHKRISHENCLRCELRNIRTGTKWYPFMKRFPEKFYQKLGHIMSGKKFIPFITPIGSAAYSMKLHSEHWQKICANADIVIAPCQAISDSMVLNGLSKDKVRILPHGIPLPSSVPEFPEIRNGKVKFYYVGRLSYVKGIHILLAAFHEIENDNIELHLIGGAQTKSEIRYFDELKKKYSDDSRIVYHGKVAPDKIYNLTKDYHVACSAAIYLEVFGLNIAEALALKKPVLSSRNGGGEAQIADGVNGWLVPQNDVAAMKVKMEEIITNPELIKYMSANCHAASIETHVKELLKIYKGLV